MASYESHIEQAKKNIVFLSQTYSINSNFWDWQITISFYIGVHILNAHLAKSADLHYRTHEAVKNAINPYNPLALHNIPEDIYLSYAKLEGLSRRSRYLCHDDYSNKGTNAFFTYEKHFAKAVKALDKIILYFNIKYDLNINDIEIICPELALARYLSIFKVKS